MIYVGPMFIGHARLKPGTALIWSCTACGQDRPQDWKFCPACGASLHLNAVAVRTLRPDLGELVQMRKNIRLALDHYPTDLAPEAEVAEHYWLPAQSTELTPAKFGDCIFLNSAAELKFATKLQAEAVKLALATFEETFKQELAQLSKCYDTWTTQCGIFVWL